MDNLTHTLVGVAIGEAGVRRRLGAGATLSLVVASNLPDLDAVLLLAGPESFLWRRGWSHSLVGMPLLGALAALVLRRFFPALGFGCAFALSLSGMVVHVLCDLLNSYGVVPLLPFSDARFELAWIFIIDLALWAILALPVVVSRGRADGPGRERPYRFALLAAAGYVLMAGAGHHRAHATLAHHAAAQVPRPSFTYVFPEALGPHRFRGVTRAGDRLALYRIDVASGTLTPARALTTVERDPAVQRLRELPFVRKLDAFYKAPVWRPVPGGHLVFDLRFVSTVLPARLTHAFTFAADGSFQGGVIPTLALDDVEMRERPVGGKP